VSIGLTFDGKFLCVPPGQATVFADHAGLDRCGEVKVKDEGHGLVSILFDEAQLQFTVPDPPNPPNFETRPKGRIGGWEQFALAADHKSITRAGRTFGLVGYSAHTELSRLHADAFGFKTDADQPVIWAHTSGFRDLDRMLRGQQNQVRAVLAQSQDQGANGRRVFAMKQNWAVKVNGIWQDGPDHTWPKEHPDFFGQVERLADLYAEFNHYLNMVVLVNARSVMPDIDQQLAFWDEFVDLARKYPHMILSLANERDAHDNAVDAWRFPQPDGVLASSGSNGGGANPPQPIWGGRWGYAELHPERRENRPSLGTTTLFFAVHGYSEGADSWPGTQITTVASEPLGFAEPEDNEPGYRRTSDPDVAWLLGVGCAWGGGGTGLSTDGIESTLLRPTQDACMRAFLAGVKAGRR
jgi:hypothetical protein